MQLSTSIEIFLAKYFAKSQYSKKTVRAYSCDLIQFSCFLKDDPSIQLIKSEHIEDWVISLKLKNYAPTSIQRKIASLKVFFNYYARKELISKSPMWSLRFDFGKIRSLPRALTIDEMNSLLVQAKKNLEGNCGINQASISHLFLCVRDLAIIELMFSTGLRVGEISSLRTNDIDLKERSIFIMGKGKRNRISFIIDAQSLKTISDYMKQRERIKTNHSKLFINRFFNPLSTQGIANIIGKISKQAALTKHITPHMLRHTAATLLLRNGADIRVVQEFLGHASISTTQRYTHVSCEQLLKTLKKHHPLAHREAESDISS